MLIEGDPPNITAEVLEVGKGPKGRDRSTERRRGVGVRIDRGIGQGVVTRGVNQIKTPITENTTASTEDPTADAAPNTPNTHNTNPFSRSSSTSPGALSNALPSHVEKTYATSRKISILMRSK